MKKKNKDNNKKIIILVVVVLVLIVAVAIAGTTYARYISQASGTGTAQVATWAVQLNDTNISQEAIFDITGDNITWDESEYIADGYIAPSRSGEFKLNLDTTGTKVAVKYTISIDDTALDSYEQISITEVNGSPAVDGTYSAVIPLSQIDTPIEIPVKITWENSEANNTSDTTIGSTVDSLSIPVTVTVEQYLGN